MATSILNFKKHCPIQVPHNENSIKYSIDTGFDIQSSLDYNPCYQRPLSQPLYKENYLGEFETEEEKRIARRNLGLFDDNDVVAMSLITTDEAITDKDILDLLKIKTINQGNIPFAPQTTATAVLVKQGNAYNTLQEVLGEQSSSIKKASSRIDQLLNKSTSGTAIKTVGDINTFLSGFKNTETLRGIIADHLLFESKGTIEQLAWQI